MTDEEKLTMIKTLTGESDTDILSAYLLLARNEVMRRAYPFGDGAEEFPIKYDTVHVQIAVYLLNKRGAEGETQHSENGVSRSYENGDIPPTLTRQIVPMAVLI